MTTPKKTTKRKHPTTEPAVPDSLSVGGRIVVKVIQRGKSWHQNVNPFVWSLPTQAPDGTWTRGEWTPKVPAIRCESGYHGTNCAPKWWGEDAVAYWMEYHPDAKVIAPSEDSEDKFCGEQCRLLRPLNRAELEAQGVYLTGKHENIGESGGNFVIGGDAEINDVRGGTINYVRGGTINYVRGGTINYVRGGTINDVRGGTINYVSGGTINYVRGGTINDVSGGTINYVRGGTINYVSGGTINDVRGGTITAHAVSNAVIVVRWNRPMVTVRSNASILDYRGSRPVHHVAPDGMSLTLAADGSVSQAKESS